MSAGRQFAVDVVHRLREAGYEALWAGGCVRDGLVGRTPKDYDVATDALPEQIRAVFGHHRTLPIGAAFGVITVQGGKEAGQIEVATFRRDAQYSDGRHPNSVSFSTAREDALRRDFTINGLFYDPVEDEIIDYVGGREDLRKQVVRAIGDPFERIAEDKLRMLRGVRFAATMGYQLEQRTLDAITQQSAQLQVVSTERVAAELRRMLVDPNRCLAMSLLKQSRLLGNILRSWSPTEEQWDETQRILASVDCALFTVSLTALIRCGCMAAEDPIAHAREICRELKLSNEESTGTGLMVQHEGVIREASSIPWPQLQRILIHPRIEEVLQYCSAVSLALDGNSGQIEFCRRKLDMPKARLNPAPLIGGDDLIKAGLSSGPHFRGILDQVRDEQLEGRLELPEAALSRALQLAEQIDSQPDYS